MALVDLDAAPLPDGVVPRLHSGVPGIVVGLTTAGVAETHATAALCDVVLGPDDPALTAVLATVEANPLAATALTALLRGGPRTVDDGLEAE